MNDKEAICKALGLETKNLLDVRLDISANQPVTVIAKYWIDDSIEIANILRNYELKAVDK